MFAGIFTKLFGSRNRRAVKKLIKIADRVTALEPDFKALSDDELRVKTREFRERLEGGESLDALIPEAFATVREAGLRTLEMRHFDVQLVGGMILHEGKITEMRTGEGKTLVATLAAYLNALPGEGVHVITVNDYLARRDAAWMGQIYEFLGMTVGVIVPGLDTEQRRAAYMADITYGTNNEFGFDYLRDNLAFNKEQRVQRPLNFAIVDEVDSILIDEARTPLIISGPADGDSDLYTKINVLIPKLTRQADQDAEGDYHVDEKAKQVYLSEAGHQTVEDLLLGSGLLPEGSSLYDATNISLMHHVNSALRAHVLFEVDVDYIVQNDEVVIVDEFTGRTMPGRRWSDGLHQAVEAKEGVVIQRENQTLGGITFQNYFRMYNKLAGMTGTADTEAFEFQQIYGLEVLVVPTNVSAARDDQSDLVFLTPDEKFKAIAEDVKDCVKRKQPVLVGTASIEVSEHIADLFKKAGIKFEVLNAKQHEREAGIIEAAGSPGAVTIATNMAGRGTDIVLGGNLEAELKALGEDPAESKVAEVKAAWKGRHQAVLEGGGLHVVGTERHESRRIDNQLRGRAGRQGDPGSSRFYLSLEDNLMRIFASDRVASLMQKLGMEEGEAIEHPWVTKAIENAQRKVEGRNFDIRKNLLEYDDVANDQRKVIYEQRSDLMSDDDIEQTIQSLRYDVVNDLIDTYVPRGSIEDQWHIPGLEEALEHQFGSPMDISGWLDADSTLHEEPLREKILATMEETYADQEARVSSEAVRHLEKSVMLQILDTQWKDHLANMDYLRKGIHLRGYAQKNPKQEFKRESFEMFERLLETIKTEVIRVLSRVRIQTESEVNQMDQQQSEAQSDMQFEHDDSAAIGEGGSDEQPDAHRPFTRDGRKVGRNEACPCGSGKKFKQCHGKIG